MGWGELFVSSNSIEGLFYRFFERFEINVCVDCGFRQEFVL